jgi:hypothetical protein
MRKIIPIAIFVSLSTPSPAMAQTLQLCRPRTNNLVQRTTQWMAYPSVPKCNKNSPKRELNLEFDFFSVPVFKDKEGNRFIQGHENLIQIPRRRETR